MRRNSLAHRERDRRAGFPRPGWSGPRRAGRADACQCTARSHATCCAPGPLRCPPGSPPRRTAACRATGRAGSRSPHAATPDSAPPEVQEATDRRQSAKITRGMSSNPEGGVRIDAAPPGSVASQMNLLPGDVLMAVNGDAGLLAGGVRADLPRTGNSGGVRGDTRRPRDPSPLAAATRAGAFCYTQASVILTDSGCHGRALPGSPWPRRSFWRGMIIAASDEASRGARDGHYVERERLKIRRTWLPLIAGLLAASLAQAQTDVLVSHYDDAAHQREPLRDHPHGGQRQQRQLRQGVRVPGRRHGVRPAAVQVQPEHPGRLAPSTSLFIATQHSSIYALDADTRDTHLAPQLHQPCGGPDYAHHGCRRWRTSCPRSRSPRPR